MPEYSPMMQQYFETKKKYPGCILMMRIGDFYEMFFDDAKTVSRELELVLTGKDCGLEERAPMCGVPYHAIEGYLTKLIQKGYRVAICEQMEDPKLAKGLVKRDVIRVVTPGTVIEGGFLHDEKNNYLCALYAENGSFGLVFADISTGEVYATDIPAGDDAENRLFSEAAAYAPSELICSKSVPQNVKDYFADRIGSLLTPAEETAFGETETASEVTRQFGEGAINPASAAAKALSALLCYIRQTQKTDLSYLKTLSVYNTGKYLALDVFTRRNLELCETMRSKEKRGSLLWVLDKTKTAGGARLLRQWIEKPLVNVREILTRQQAVAELVRENVRRGEITNALKKVVDTERLLTRLVYGTANARDLLALEQTVSALPAIASDLEPFTCEAMVQLRQQFDVLEDIGQSIHNTIDEDPPIVLREGGIIRPGMSAAVDELREMMNDGKNFLARIEQDERERTGIRTLKVGYNKVFGYYIEVSKSFVGSVPDTYIRRQTLTTGERYVTEELKEMESRIVGAKERDNALEYELFTQLREHILQSKERLQKTSQQLSWLDAVCSLATAASENNYVCPEIDQSDALYLKDSRHPVVEKFTKEKYFVPNDCDMDCKSRRIMLITGPNMAGKSTYMRQIALCVLMAQIGSFVPASEARIGVCDRIFTRVGASDDLSSGDSTFMLEMKEVAHILTGATRESLIVYDEIGRGTSTFDGMSIARAVLEYTNRRIGARTLFATHYHELTALEQDDNGILNYHIAAKKRAGDIVFLRKIIRGGTDDSYGIEVASLAGVPKEVLTGARAYLKELESNRPAERPAQAENENVTFADVSGDIINRRLREIDVNTLTPIEAISILYELKKQAEEG